MEAPVTLTQTLTALGIVLSTSVALLIAYLHRQQMRQNERYRTNPELGLVPPDSKLTAFFKDKWDMLLGVGGPLLILALQMTSSRPITRWDVLLIILCFVVIATATVGRLAMNLVERMAQSIVALHEFSAKHFAITADTVGALGEVVGVTKQLGVTADMAEALANAGSAKLLDAKSPDSDSSKGST